MNLNEENSVMHPAQKGFKSTLIGIIVSIILACTKAAAGFIGNSFKDHQQRLNVLDQKIREAALKYAEEFYHTGKCTKEEALEKGIAKAELALRKL